MKLEEVSPPSVDTFWSKEGTLAHEVHEALLNRKPVPEHIDVSDEMVGLVEKSTNKIRAIHKAFGGVLLVEKKVFASFIHPEMFGTCDAIIAGADGTLHIFDFKYGAGHIVEAKENSQLIQYALSVAESYDWQFDFVKMWILQPRAGSDWYKSWSIPMSELKNTWWPTWVNAVKRVEKNSQAPNPGAWCHWCRAKRICPAKIEVRAEKVSERFNSKPIESEVTNAEENKVGKTKSGGQTARRKRVFKGEAESFGLE